MNPYIPFVTDFVAALQRGRSLPLGGFPKPTPVATPPPAAPKALFFAPHPDDECITGGPALRCLREAGMEVLNVAVTQGSKKERQAGRLEELRHACDYLGLGLVTTLPGGLEKVNPKAREQEPAHWAASVRVIRDILHTHRPRVILFPHDRDWNSTHIGTHHLVMDALQQLPDLKCYLLETEFWGAMTDPNLMVEISAADLADMIAACSFHVGEVQRNPYHLTLPAWMMDNVRRGGEVVGGQGGAAPDFQFAALCRLRKWSGGRVEKLYDGGRQLASAQNIGTLFPAL